MTVNKSKATPQQVRGARTTFTIRNRSGGRRSLGVVAGLAKKGYRPDLRAVSTPLSFPSFEAWYSSCLVLEINRNALSLELAGTPTRCMKVERGHVCNIQVVHLLDCLHQAFFLSVYLRCGEAQSATTFPSVLDYPVVYLTNGMSWTGCPWSHLCSHRRTKRKEDTSTKEGSGEEGSCITVLACISSILFAMHFYDKIKHCYAS